MGDPTQHIFLFQAPTTNHPSLFRDTARTDRFHWIALDPPPELVRTQMMECHFRFIHQMPLSEFSLFRVAVVEGKVSQIHSECASSVCSSLHSDSEHGRFGLDFSLPASQSSDTWTGIGHHPNVIVCNSLRFSYQIDLISRLKRHFFWICPTQFAVLYKGDDCLGSGKIVQLGPSEYTLQRGREQLVVNQQQKEEEPTPDPTS